MQKISAKLFASVSLIITVTVAEPPFAGHAAPEVVAWGDNGNAQTDVPSGLSNVVAIAGSLALLQQPTVPTPRLALLRGMTGLDLQAHGVPGISCQLLRASQLPGPWLPAEPVTFTNNVQVLRAPDASAPAQFFRLPRK